MSADMMAFTNSRIHVAYQSSVAESPSLHPRLLLRFEIGYTVAAGTEMLEVAVSCSGDLRITKETGVDYFVGHLAQTEPLLVIYPGNTTGFQLALDLDHYDLRQIEKVREAKDLSLTANLRFVAEITRQPQTKRMLNCQIPFRIPKSDWVEKLLPQMEFKTVSLLEIPQLADSEFQEVTNYVNEAWKQFSMGEYERVFVDCRKALESLSAKVKSKGYEKTNEGGGGRKEMPDWGKLLGNEDAGDILGVINQKIIGFVAPGSHAGRAISKEDADFALMTTHAFVNLVTRKLSVT